MKSTKTIHTTWLWCLTGFLFLSVAALTDSPDPPVKVQLLLTSQPVTLMGSSNCVLSTEDGRSLFPLSSGKPYRFKIVSGLIEVRSEKQTTWSSSSSLYVDNFSPDSTVTLLEGDQEKGLYRGRIQINHRPDDKIQIILITPMEDYLRGVLPCEMQPEAPMEALKAQAVAARTKAFYQMLQRNHKGDDFDLCSGAHCQVYKGLKVFTERTDRAIVETRGIILTYLGRPIDCFYSSNCGGHTESCDHAWNGPALAYANGVGDCLEKKRLDLRQEKDIKTWVESEPDVYCNPEQGARKDNKSANNNFRWEVRQTAGQLEQRANKFRKIGRIKKLVPLERGVSGRILRLEVVGEKGKMTLKTEQSIRWLFKPSLPSSAFIVETQGKGDFPDLFILRGAGHGHGVGICQAGAMGMASKGKTYTEILKHYHPGTKQEKQY